MVMAKKAVALLLTARSAVALKELLRWECDGSVYLLPDNPSLATGIDLSMGKRVGEQLLKMISDNAECLCPEASADTLSKGYMFNFENFLGWLSGTNAVSNKADYLACEAKKLPYKRSEFGFVNGSFGYIDRFYDATISLPEWEEVFNHELNLPASCASYSTTGQCAMKYKIQNLGVDIGFSAKKCPGTNPLALPEMSFTCVGPDCETLMMPCTASTDCSGSLTCGELVGVDSFVQNVVDGLASTKLYDATSFCDSFGYAATAARKVIDSTMSWMAGFMGSTSPQPKTSGMNICGAAQLSAIYDEVTTVNPNPYAPPDGSDCYSYFYQNDFTSYVNCAGFDGKGPYMQDTTGDAIADFFTVAINSVKIAMDQCNSLTLAGGQCDLPGLSAWTPSSAAAPLVTPPAPLGKVGDSTTLFHYDGETLAVLPGALGLRIASKAFTSIPDFLGSSVVQELTQCRFSDMPIAEIKRSFWPMDAGFWISMIFEGSGNPNPYLAGTAGFLADLRTALLNGGLEDYIGFNLVQNRLTSVEHCTLEDWEGDGRCTLELSGMTEFFNKPDDACIASCEQDFTDKFYQALTTGFTGTEFTNGFNYSTARCEKFQCPETCGGTSRTVSECQADKTAITSYDFEFQSFGGGLPGDQWCSEACDPAAFTPIAPTTAVWSLHVEAPTANEEEWRMPSIKLECAGPDCANVGLQGSMFEPKPCVPDEYLALRDPTAPSLTPNPPGCRCQTGLGLKLGDDSGLGFCPAEVVQTLVVPGANGILTGEYTAWEPFDSVGQCCNIYDERKNTMNLLLAAGDQPPMAPLSNPLTVQEAFLLSGHCETGVDVLDNAMNGQNLFSKWYTRAVTEVKAEVWGTSPAVWKVEGLNALQQPPTPPPTSPPPPGFLSPAATAAPPIVSLALAACMLLAA